MNPSKHLLPGDQCFHLFFLHFLGRCIRVFLVRIGRIVGSLPPRVKDSFDLSTVPRPAGYQFSGDLSSFPFPVKRAKTKDIANSKI